MMTLICCSLMILTKDYVKIDRLGITVAGECRVHSVRKGSLAQRAGLKPGDRITGATIAPTLGISPIRHGQDLQDFLKTARKKSIILNGLRGSEPRAWKISLKDISDLTSTSDPPFVL